MFGSSIFRYTRDPQLYSLSRQMPRLPPSYESFPAKEREGTIGHPWSTRLHGWSKFSASTRCEAPGEDLNVGGGNYYYSHYKLHQDRRFCRPTSPYCTKDYSTSWINKSMRTYCPRQERKMTVW